MEHCYGGVLRAEGVIAGDCGVVCESRFVCGRGVGGDYYPSVRVWVCHDVDCGFG